jgi:hypothetical protein
MDRTIDWHRTTVTTNYDEDAGFVVLTPCSPLKDNRRFRGTYRLYLQGRSRTRYQRQTDNSTFHLLSRWYLSRIIRSWKRRRYVPPKRRLTFNGLQERYQRESRLHSESPALTLVSFSAYSTSKMGATCSSETSVYFQRTTGRYIPEDSTLYSDDDWLMTDGTWKEAVVASF